MGAASAPVVLSPASPTTGVRDSRVIIYVVLALLALLPGLANWGLAAWGYGVVGEGTIVGIWHQQMTKALQDINFGSGIRFWLGVAGATMMGLLLLYPVRKLLAQRFPRGVRGWFHIHIIFGLLGPVLILYHCNFGFGGFNANVALITMLIVAISGIVGQFVYQRISAGFYGDKQQARVHLDAVIGQLQSFHGQDPAKTALIERLEAFETQLLTPRRGLIASLIGSLRVEVRRRQFFRDAGVLLATAQRANGWNKEQHQGMRHLVGTHLGAYVSTARRAAGRSIREQLWARWRMFHLPFFLIMSVATVLHVYAVWDMDGPADKPAGQRAAVDMPVETAGETPAAAETPAIAPQAPRTGGIQQQIRKSVRIESAAGGSAPTSASGEIAQPDAMAGRPQPPRKQPDQIASLLGADAQEQAGQPALATKPTRESKAAAEATPDATAPLLMEKPKPASRPAQKRVVDDAYRPPQTAPTIEPAPVKPAAAKTEPVKTEPVKIAEAPVAKPVPSAPKAVAVAEPAPAVAPADPVQRLAEVSKQIESQPMGLGAAKGGTLKERIASLRAERFDHGKTKFPLTGKHTKVACEDCHKKSLENTPKDCIACHRKDDVHRGRRPDCARCHTTNNWGQIRRR